MKYRPDDYAKALAEAAASTKDEKAVIKNFLALLERNTDLAQLPAILERADRIIRRKTGKRKVTIESARPLTEKTRKEIEKFIKDSDAVEEKVKADLIAGVRITVDDEMQFDGSLQKKLEKIFESA